VDLIRIEPSNLARGQASIPEQLFPLPLKLLKLVFLWILTQSELAKKGICLQILSIFMKNQKYFGKGRQRAQQKNQLYQNWEHNKISNKLNMDWSWWEIEQANL
jgi:hypothetical protein